MTVLKRYVLRLFISLKYITANVVDRNNGRIVATASTVEHAIKGSLECGRSCNAKAAGVVGEVLAMRLKVEGLEEGQGRGIHVDVNKEVEKKGFKNRTKIWAVVNGLKNNGIKLILDDDENSSRPRPPLAGRVQAACRYTRIQLTALLVGGLLCAFHCTATRGLPMKTWVPGSSTGKFPVPWQAASDSAGLLNVSNSSNHMVFQSPNSKFYWMSI
ncbi:hypothetical protein CK203_083489 [Vitis vinifera]|uniref:50S ribosomal protein L18 n=1 Tax=Vitis vinifera TaxID=29760 RepID=A0A438C2S2_VITVI|nr:hypothetical protein CK203_083489 [Vitis vinifera]